MAEGETEKRIPLHAVTGQEILGNRRLPRATKMSPKRRELPPKTSSTVKAKSRLLRKMNAANGR